MGEFEALRQEALSDDQKGELNLMIDHFNQRFNQRFMGVNVEKIS